MRSSRSRSAPSRARSPSGCGVRTPTSRRACGSRRRVPRRPSRSASREPRPGLVFRAPNGCVVVVLPGPPPELQRLWPNALASEPVRELLARTTPPRPPRPPPVRRQRVRGRARARRGRGRRRRRRGDDLRARVRDPRRPRRRAGRGRAGGRPGGGGSQPLEQWVFSRDERSVEEHVLALARARGLTLATAESCTGGLVAARLTRVPGSSESFLGGGRCVRRMR